MKFPTGYVDQNGRAINIGDVVLGYCEYGGEVKGPVIFKDGNFFIDEPVGPGGIMTITHLDNWHHSVTVLFNIDDL